MLIGKKAPDFCAEALVNGKITKVSLKDYSSSYKILFFYPLDFTFVCPTEIHAFQDALAEFEKRNAQVIGVSVDSVYSHEAWTKMPKTRGGIEGVTFALVSDLNKNIARQYDVLDEASGVALRGLFIIDTNDIVQVMWVNNQPLGRNVCEVIRLLDALIFTKQHGQVCPANWQIGQKAIVPNFQGVQKYFEKQN